ncbi:hypothetical protein RDI58_026961 [Solanum bulbocastanum]|uniref:Uncharacterized protein n=1 Tax=Solanum bulbocastanum TaxID=147425 RepID=A0AAN8Y1C8_SOLBU
MRLCPHSPNIREYEGLPELQHSKLEPVGNVRSSSSEALLPHKLLRFPFIVTTEEKTIRKHKEKKSHSDQGSSTKQIAHTSHKGSKKIGEGKKKTQEMQDPQDNEINSRSSPQDQIPNNEAAVTIFEKNKPIADAAQVEKEALALAEFHEPLQVHFTSVGVVGDDSNMIARTWLCEIKMINRLRAHRDVEIEHALREGQHSSGFFC